MTSHGLTVDDLPRTPKRREIDEQSEHDSQCAVVQWATLMRGQWPELDLLFAVPNQGSRRMGAAGRLKGEGMKAGVPDLMLPVAKGGAIGLAIEMKAGRGKPTERQQWWLDNLAMWGWITAVCWSAKDAIDTLEDYLCGKINRKA